MKKSSGFFIQINESISVDFSKIISFQVDAYGGKDGYEMNLRAISEKGEALNYQICREDTKFPSFSHDIRNTKAKIRDKEYYFNYHSIFNKVLDYVKDNSNYYIKHYSIEEGSCDDFKYGNVFNSGSNVSHYSFLSRSENVNSSFKNSLYKGRRGECSDVLLIYKRKDEKKLSSVVIKGENVIDSAFKFENVSVPNMDLEAGITFVIMSRDNKSNMYIHRRGVAISKFHISFFKDKNENFKFGTKETDAEYKELLHSLEDYKMQEEKNKKLREGEYGHFQSKRDSVDMYLKKKLSIKGNILDVLNKDKVKSDEAEE